MPAYVQHHHIVEMTPVVCPGCLGLLPMFVRQVEPHWNIAKIDFIFECADCGAEVRQTVTSRSSGTSSADSNIRMPLQGQLLRMMDH